MGWSEGGSSAGSGAPLDYSGTAEERGYADAPSGEESGEEGEEISHDDHGEREGEGAGGEYEDEEAGMGGDEERPEMVPEVELATTTKVRLG
jgi:hypothetical protein